ncbi:hypothetical protein P7K49_032195 [Saguinus oedipus]|uniref:Uncharacterized protein n=1 Tax=Saguinus oedipus TaxID=9490 RepID=A0ABQ9TYC3_SAGOE|nr:hypothetical protein P7K49_032195 [Saguinus oedipus]
MSDRIMKRNSRKSKSQSQKVEKPTEASKPFQVQALSWCFIPEKEKGMVRGSIGVRLAQRSTSSLSFLASLDLNRKHCQAAYGWHSLCSEQGSSAETAPEEAEGPDLESSDETDHSSKTLKLLPIMCHASVPLHKEFSSVGQQPLFIAVFKTQANLKPLCYPNPKGTPLNKRQLQNKVLGTHPEHKRSDVFVTHLMVLFQDFLSLAFDSSPEGTDGKRVQRRDRTGTVLAVLRCGCRFSWEKQHGTSI